MNAVNVGNLLSLVLLFLIITGFTLENDLMSAVNVGNLLGENPTSLNIGEFTLEKGMVV